MALLTAGTKTTSSLSALIWQPAGMNQTDLAALVALIRNPALGSYGSLGATSRGFIENGYLFYPSSTASPGGIKLVPNDLICVDGAGNPFVLPARNYSTSWQHS